MKNRIIIFILGLLFVTSCSSNDIYEGEEPINRDGKPMVVGYLPLWKMPFIPKWDRLTHINFAFGQVEEDGNLNLKRINNNKFLIAEAQKHNVKAILSIGGGQTKAFSSAILSDDNRKRLVDQLEKAVVDLNLDGLDIDFEEWTGGTNGASDQDKLKAVALEKLFIEVRARIGYEKLLTVATTADWDRGEGSYGLYNCFTNSMHEHLDFVNLMIYDLTGPWSGTIVGQHSSKEFFHAAIDHWLKNRQIPKEKIVAGVPFYGRKFLSDNNAAGAQEMSYSDILKNYPNDEAHLRDQIGLLYYNGIPTIQYKTQYIKENKMGGIMIWELTEDTKDPHKSLLNAIHEVVIK